VANITTNVGRLVWIIFSISPTTPDIAVPIAVKDAASNTVGT